MGVVDSVWAGGGWQCGDSRDVRLASFFHGPGESSASRGEGRGATSPMAEITGLGTAELAAEADAKAPARALRLGVLDTGRRDWADDLLCRESAGRCTDLDGVARPLAVSGRWVADGDSERGRGPGSTGGGDGAMV